MIRPHRCEPHIVVSLAAATMSLAFIEGCAHPYVRRLECYRAAKKAKDYEAAATYLNPDARIWFGSKDGPGRPLRPKGGPYAQWDREFRSSATRKDVRVVGETVTYVSYEMNDFYRLIDRQPTGASVTYYFDDQGRIEGMLYARLDDEPSQTDRQEEFERWAAEKYPGLLESEDMRIPNNPRRWRELLVEWRADIGLPPID